MSEENTTSQKPEPAEEPKPTRTRSGGTLALLLSLLTLIGIGALLWLGYPHWQSMRQDMLALQQSLADSQAFQQQMQTSLDNARKLIAQYPSSEQLTEQETNLQLQQQLLAKARTAMEQREVALRASIAELRKRSGKPDNRWMVAEAEYLLQLAQARLQLSADIGTAISAIRQAEQRLLETGDGKWTDIRRQLTDQADKLALIKQPDIQQLSAQISQLIEHVPQLQAAYRNPFGEAAKPDSKVSVKSATDKTDWQALLQSLSDSAAEAIRIRRHDQAPAALLAPAQEQLLYQNLSLILETSRLALQQRNTALFHDNLQRAADWIRSRFNTKQANAIDMLAQLSQLAATELKPSLPDLTPTLAALQTRKILLESPTEPAVQQP